MEGIVLMVCTSISTYLICQIRNVVSGRSGVLMRLTVTICIMLSNIMLSGCLVASQTEVPAAPPGVKTDRGVYPLPPAPVLPRAGGVFTDPTFGTEVMRVTDENDGSGRVRRLAHQRSVFKSYWDSPRTNISRHGRFIVFTSNWEGADQRDVFILKVPAM